MRSVPVDEARLQQVGRDLLVALGEDPERPGLRDTPARWARWWAEFIDGDHGEVDRTFETVTTDQMVIVHGLPVWTLCEHHVLPFHCRVAVGYITRDRVLGLSKFARLARRAAGRLQLQEQLVDDIATDVERATGSPDVMVLAQGVHLCMLMRGVRSPGTMVSSITRGAFQENVATREEFLRLVAMGPVAL